MDTLTISPGLSHTSVREASSIPRFQAPAANFGVFSGLNSRHFEIVNMSRRIESNAPVPLKLALPIKLRLQQGYIRKYVCPETRHPRRRDRYGNSHNQGSSFIGKFHSNYLTNTFLELNGLCLCLQNACYKDLKRAESYARRL